MGVLLLADGFFILRRPSWCEHAMRARSLVSYVIMTQEKFMRSKILAVALAATMLTTACTEPDGSPGRGIMNGGALNKQEAGVALGVVGGGILGSTIGGGSGQVLATVAGGLLGGLLGGSIGQSLDDADRAAYDRAAARAMNNGSAQSWKTDNASGTIRPKKRYVNDDGLYCREYTQTIVVDGKTDRGHGTACRGADGAWRLDE